MCTPKTIVRYLSSPVITGKPSCQQNFKNLDQQKKLEWIGLVL
jgi:hypothetical protein